MSKNLTQGEKIDVYVRLREHKDQATKEFKKSMERVNEAMLKLEAELLEEFQQSGVTQAKGQTGATAFIKTFSSFKTTDRDAFLRFAVKSKNLELMDIRPNRTVMKEMVEKGIHVDGVDATHSQTIQINKGRK